MKLHFLIFSFFSILYSFQTKCQTVSTETFALSKYLFEKDANALNPLSTIIPSSQKTYTYFISGKNSSGLSIKGNEIFVKDRFQKKFFQQQQIKFSIAIKEDKKEFSSKPGHSSSWCMEKYRRSTKFYCISQSRYSFWLCRFGNRRPYD